MYRIGIFLLFFLASFSVARADVFTTENTFNRSGYADNCTGAETNHVAVTLATLPSTWTGNTIYDFSAGTYDITSTIVINSGCTALVGGDGVVLSGTIAYLINTTVPFSLIKNISLFMNDAASDGIRINSNNITLLDMTISHGSRGVLINGFSNNLIKNSKLFNNSSAGISLAASSNNNIMDNVLSFNNSGAASNGISIASSKNTINNSAFFNNSTNGIFISAGNGNVINNSLFYNNNSYGIRVQVAGNYINTSKTFNNTLGNNFVVASTTGYGLISADVALPANLKTGSSADALLTTNSIGRVDGTQNTGLVVDATQIINPYNGSVYLLAASITGRGPQSFGSTSALPSASFGSNIPSQIQSVKRNGSALDKNTLLGFDSSKKIGDSFASAVAGGGGGGGGNSCGNGMLGSNEQCDDGNTANGDGCTSVCMIEQPGICGNKILEYTEQCDDGNLKDGDGCSALCKIEDSADIYITKYDLNRSLIAKSLAINPNLLNSKKITNTSELIMAGLSQAEISKIYECQYTDASYHAISFKDIDTSYKQGIQTLLNYCIIQGTRGSLSQRNFDTQKTATAAEFIKTVIKTYFLGKKIDFSNPSLDIHQVYADVKNSEWYAPYVMKAYAENLLSPLETSKGNRFVLSPDASISRVKAVQFLISVLKLDHKNPQNLEVITDTFDDSNKPLTRGEMAALVYYGYQLNYADSLVLRSNNKKTLENLAKTLKKYPKDQEILMTQKFYDAFKNLKESDLAKQKIYKKGLLTDLQEIIEKSKLLF